MMARVWVEMDGLDQLICCPMPICNLCSFAVGVAEIQPYLASLNVFCLPFEAENNFLIEVIIFQSWR